MLIIHGIIHLFGYLKAFKIAKIENLKIDISKPLGILWLISTLLFVLSGILLLTENHFWIIPAAIAVILSQILIVKSWKDAKFGTIPNVIVLIVIIPAISLFIFKSNVNQEIERIKNIPINENKTIVESEIENLPKSIQLWLKTSGVIGKKQMNYTKLTQYAKMKMKPEQQDWYEAEAIQFIRNDEPSFVWFVNLKMMGFIDIYGRDKFENGKGEMLIKIFSLFNIVNSAGDRIDEATMQRYLGEIIWSPSAALSKLIRWEEMNEFSARAIMNYKGRKVIGEFYFNPDGDFVRFRTERYFGSEDNAERKIWEITARDYKSFDGIRLPSEFDVYWKLGEKEWWNWMNLKITDIEYNNPGNW